MPEKIPPEDDNEDAGEGDKSTPTRQPRTREPRAGSDESYNTGINPTPPSGDGRARVLNALTILGMLLIAGVIVGLVFLGQYVVDRWF